MHSWTGLCYLWPEECSSCPKLGVVRWSDFVHDKMFCKNSFANFSHPFHQILCNQFQRLQSLIYFWSQCGWRRGRSGHSSVLCLGEPSTRRRRSQSLECKLETRKKLTQDCRDQVTWVRKAHPDQWWCPLQVPQLGRMWCFQALPNVE